MREEPDFNPYAPPQSQRLVGELSPDAIRHAHVRHESEIKGVGLLYGLLGGIMLLATLVRAGDQIFENSPQVSFTRWLLGLLISVGILVLGVGLRRLAPWVRIPVAVFSGILGVLYMFTIFGPFINGYVMWLMLAAKGRMVMSHVYHRVVDLTPEVKSRFSIVSVFLILMLLLFIVAVLAVLFAPFFSARHK